MHAFTRFMILSIASVSSLLMTLPGHAAVTYIDPRDIQGFPQRFVETGYLNVDELLKFSGRDPSKFKTKNDVEMHMKEISADISRAAEKLVRQRAPSMCRVDKTLAEKRKIYGSSYTYVDCTAPSVAKDDPTCKSIGYPVLASIMYHGLWPQESRFYFGKVEIVGMVVCVPDLKTYNEIIAAYPTAKLRESIRKEIKSPPCKQTICQCENNGHIIQKGEACDSKWTWK